MGLFPNTLYLEFFTDNLAVNRYSFVVSTIILAALTIFHIINLCSLSKDEHSATSEKESSLRSNESKSTNLNSPKRTKRFGSKLSAMSNSATRPSISISSNKPSASTTSKIIKFYRKSNQAKYVILSHAMTVATMIFFVLHGVVDVLDFYGVFHKTLSLPCRSVRILSAVVWHCGKTTMYIIFYARIQFAFYDTSFAYSNKISHGLLFLIFNFWLSCMVGDAFEILGDLRYDSYYGTYWCQQLVPLWGCIATPVYDGFISILCLYLFVRPLYKVMAYSDKMDMHTVDVIIKYTVLTFIAVFTTTLVLTIMIFRNYGVLFCFDVIVNVITIMLMSRSYDKYYRSLCGCITGCVQSSIQNKAKMKSVQTEDHDKVIIELPKPQASAVTPQTQTPQPPTPRSQPQTPRTPRTPVDDMRIVYCDDHEITLHVQDENIVIQSVSGNSALIL
eukprot:253800_1